MERNKLNASQEAWLRALESGEWAQCSDWLWQGVKSERSYCCLGVASEMFCPNSRNMKPVDSHEAQSVGGVAPYTVRNLLRLVDQDGTRKNGGDALVEMNDNGLSFAEIAAEVRANPQEFFTNFDAEAAQ